MDMKRVLLPLVLILVLFSNTCFGGSEVAVTALSYIGQGEEWKDNHGEFIRKINQGREGEPWCAGFVSFVLLMSGKTEIGYTLSAREIYRRGKKVKEPKVGDIICFKRGKNPRLGHVGIIVRVTDSTIETVEGNTGKFPSYVKKIKYNRKNIKNLLGFVRA